MAFSDSTMPVGDPLLGQTIDNYQIVEAVGHGGMGVVYRARDITLDRDVAIKMMNAQLLAWEQHRKRFEVEARALAKLRHHNIVDVYALRDTSFGLMIVMEFVHGESLLSVLGQHVPVPIDKAITIYTQLLQGLNHAHQMGIVHRDIKPANILFSDNRLVKITDFGLAKLKDVSTLTQAGSTMGTPAYMSPEQVRGTEVDHRSDIWSAGILLYEMVVGKVPFEATQIPALYYQIGNDIPTSPRKARPEVADWIDKLITRSLAKESNGRPQSCAEILNEIAHQLNKPELRVDPASVTTTTLPLRRRRLLVASIGGGAVALVLALWVMMTVISRHQGINIITTPAGATVVVDGDSMGTTPLAGKKLPSGPFRLKLALQGYFPVETTLTAHPEPGSVLAFQLEKPGPALAGGHENTSPLPEVGGGEGDIRSGPSRCQSPYAFAAYVAEALRRSPATASGPVVILPFQFENTGFSDRFSLLLKNILDGTMSSAGGWTVYEMRVLQRDGTGRERSRQFDEASGFIIKGTYWRYDDSLRILATIVRSRDGVLLKTLEAMVPGKEYRRLQWKADDLKRILREKASYAASKSSRHPVEESDAAHPGSDKTLLTSQHGVATDLRLEIWTNKGKEGLIFVEGDTIELHVRATKPCYIRMAYHMADGRRILPTGEDSYRLDAVGNSPLEKVWVFECSPPFGAEFLHVFAKISPFEQVVATYRDGYWQLNEETNDFVAATRGIKPLSRNEPQAEASLSLTTIPKVTLPIQGNPYPKGEK